MAKYHQASQPGHEQPLNSSIKSESEAQARQTNNSNEKVEGKAAQVQSASQAPAGKVFNQVSTGEPSKTHGTRGWASYPETSETEMLF